MKIEVKKVSKKFQKNEVLKETNLVFESGKIYSLVGRNGSGKTVLLKILCGLYYPASGEVLFDGIDYLKEGGFPKSLGALIENPSFIDSMTGLENLEMLAKINKKIGKKEILETLKLVGLYEERNKLYYKYSMGTKQKLGLAQAFMEDPDILILDEPFNGIEEETVERLRNYLLKQKEEGKLIILSTHIKEDIEKVTDVIYRVDNGVISEVH